MPSEREEVKYNCCPDVPYPIIRYHVKMQRRTKFYLFNLIIPGTLIGLVAILTFILPPACGERVGIGITNLLAMMVFLLLVSLLVFMIPFVIIKLVYIWWDLLFPFRIPKNFGYLDIKIKYPLCTTTRLTVQRSKVLEQIVLNPSTIVHKLRHGWGREFRI